MAVLPIKPGVKGWQPKVVASTPAVVTTGKVSLDPSKFDNLINNQGVKVKVYRSSYCPRVKSIDGAEHDIECPLCRGMGFIDRYPLDTFAVIQEQNLEKSHFAEGFYDGNTVQATFPRGVELQYFTLVELVDFTDLFFERVRRQNGVTDNLRYKALRVNMLVDASGAEYYEGSDFRLDVNGSISWDPNGRQPGRGVIYTINYEMSVRYRAIKAGHVSRFAQVTTANVTDMVKMPEMWTLQKSFLVERKDLEGHPITPNKIREADSELGPASADAERL